MNYDSTLLHDIPTLQQDIPLAPFTYMRIGGPAKYFVNVQSSEQLEGVIKVALTAGVPFCILGGGANVLVSDAGYDGLVIRNTAHNARIDKTFITVDSGYNLTHLAALAAEKGLSGLEFAFGIPGTVGGAVYGNAGAFDGAMKEVVQSARVIGMDGAVKTMSNADMNFQYRHSVLKEKFAVVLTVVLKLTQGDAPAIRALQQQRIEYRRKNQPLALPSMGSVFKNVSISDFPEKYMEKFHIAEKGFKEFIPAGYINEVLGLKGMKIGDAQLSDKHGNFIVNIGNATAEQVLMLVSAIKQKVRTHCDGLALREEIQMVGF